MEAFYGPLGSHRNYISHIALPNCTDYFHLQERNIEQGNTRTSYKYEEMRYFLNAIESLNNILDYYFYEHEENLHPSNLKQYKENIMNKHPLLRKVADLANAYKHCVRESYGKRKTDLPWAKDLQNPALTISIDLTNPDQINSKEDIKVNIQYSFEWPIDSQEQILVESFRFWIFYSDPGGPDLSPV